MRQEQPIDLTSGVYEAAGLRVQTVRDNPYEFLSDSARGASDASGIESISLLAVKPA